MSHSKVKKKSGDPLEAADLNPLTISEEIQSALVGIDFDESPGTDAAPEGSEKIEIEELDGDILPEDLEVVQIRSVIESLLLAYDKPITMNMFKEVFRGTNVSTDQLKKSLNELTTDYAGAERGLCLYEVGGGYQLRTKPENQVFIRKLTKGRSFKLSGPSLEVLSIVAYKQPIIKSEIDSIRGVESGHLVRALMDRSLVKFVGKSELPGKPMLYGTTKKFLEIFGLRDLRELPSLAEIDELLPEGMTSEEATSEPKAEERWGSIHDMTMQYQQDPGSDHEWEKLTEEISKIETTSDYFENERKLEKSRKDQEKAEILRQSLLEGKDVSNREKKWLEKYESQLHQNGAYSTVIDATS